MPAFFLNWRVDIVSRVAYCHARSLGRKKQEESPAPRVLRGKKRGAVVSCRFLLSGLK
jgi:hypothetical protein